MAEKTLFQQVFPQTVEDYVEDIITVSLMVPESNPNDDDCSWGAPICLWGGSGIGKTAQIHQAARRAALPSELLLASQLQPEDFGGIPMLNVQAIIRGIGLLMGGMDLDETMKQLGKYASVNVVCALGQIQRLLATQEGLLVLDEASNTPPATQGAMLSMLFGKLIGDTRIPLKVRMILAANPPQIAAGGYGFEPPTANRIIHFGVGAPPFEQFRKWWRTEGTVEEKPVHALAPLLKKNWARDYSASKGLFLSYLETNRRSLYKQPTEGDPMGGYAWASPRMWVTAARCVATIRAIGLPEQLESLFVAGCVGHGESIAWEEFKANNDLPSAQDVLDGNWKLDKSRIDRTKVVVDTVVSYIGDSREGQADLAVQGWGFMEKLIAEKYADIAMAASEDLINRYRLGIDHKNKTVAKAAGNVMLKLGLDSVGQFAKGAT